MDIKKITPLFLCCLACSTPSKNNPLKNTIKLTKEGHANLYNNGAFQVPSTNIKLIPEGPQMWQFAYQQAGPGAHKSFVTALGNAADSVIVVANGTKMSYRWASQMNNKSQELASEVHGHLKKDSIQIILKSNELAHDIIGGSWDLAKSSSTKVGIGARNMRTDGLPAIEQSADVMNQAGAELRKKSTEQAATLSSQSVQKTGSGLKQSYQNVILGMISYPKQVQKRTDDMEFKKSFDQFVESSSDYNVTRERYSEHFKDGLKQSLGDAGSNTSKSFSEAANNLKETSNSGVSLATLKAVTNLLEGIFWHATIKPLGQLTYNGLGYLVTNTVAYPIVIVANASARTSWLAVKVVWNSSLMAYDLVSPTISSGLAAALNIAQFGAEQVAAGVVITGGNISGATVQAGSKIYEVGAKGAIVTTSGAVEYVGVPLTYAGVGVAGTAIGLGTGATGIVVGATEYTGSKVGAAAIYTGGKLGAATTLVGGTVASVGVGAALGVYEVGKSVVVPSTQILGAGVVLTYGNIIHLGAHTLLGVSDAAYLVLSMEGPKAVIYAVKGVVGANEDLPEGTVIDLQKLREKGDVIYQVPVSDDEIKKVMESF